MDQYKYLNSVKINNAPHIEEYVFEIPDYTLVVLNERKTHMLQWLFVQYVTIMYRLIVSRKTHIKYYIPYNIAKPLLLICKKLKIFPWFSPYYFALRDDTTLLLTLTPLKEVEYMKKLGRIYSIVQHSIDAIYADDPFDVILHDLYSVEQLISKNTLIHTPNVPFMFQISRTSNKPHCLYSIKNTIDPFDVLYFYESLIGVDYTAASNQCQIVMNTPVFLKNATVFFKGIYSGIDKTYYDKCAMILYKIRTKLII